MTFDKSRVYTALNADEVKPGSKGYFANTVEDMKKLVSRGTGLKEVFKIEPEDYSYRFAITLRTEHELMAFNLFYLVEESFKKEYRPYKDTEEMTKDFKKRFHVDNPNYTMPLIWVKEKVTDISMLITAFGAGNNRIYNHNHWINLKELLTYYTYLGGSPCGILEK